MIEIDSFEQDVAEEQAVDAVSIGWAKSDGFAAQGLGSLEAPVGEAETAVGVDRPDSVMGGIFEGVDLGLEGSRARAIALCGNGQL